ncbi:MAG: neutral zinc metallopeptidase [Deltaproteobacteria bacterium]|nr:neutral zinc metallopeptidase [Deltaproteobacteria bacterium]
MRLDDDGDRSNVEDRRGSGLGAALGGSGVKLGLGGTILLLALSAYFRQDLFAVIGASPAVGGAAGPVAGAPDERRSAAETPLEKVAVASFNDSQRVWKGALGERYRPARLVLFWDQTRSGCGAAGAEMGPFYCPADEKVYIDLGFYRELASRFGAPGAFAQSYVIAHEVGHHLQSVLGIEPQVREAQRRHPEKRNALSVRLELQADCFAGVWGRSTEQRHLLDPGDLEAGLGAAAAVGDDRIQKSATGRVSPESFTHGSAAQRTQWFRRGFDSGRIEACDTFAASAL